MSTTICIDCRLNARGKVSVPPGCIVVNRRSRSHAAGEFSVDIRFDGIVRCRIRSLGCWSTNWSWCNS